MTTDFDKPCGCGRVGETYAVYTCPIDAPIPFKLTVRGKREAAKMRQWDAIGETLRLRQVNAEQAKERRAQLAEGRRIEARVRPAVCQETLGCMTRMTYNARMNSPKSLRERGVKMVKQGFAPMNRGTIKPVHVRAEWNTTLCGKTLSEPSTIGAVEYLGQYRVCTACDRKLGA